MILKYYFYRYYVTSMSNKDIKYLQTSDSIDDIATCYIELTQAQVKFYEENLNASYLEVYNCKLDPDVIIENPNSGETSGTTSISATTYHELLRTFISEKYSMSDELEIINDFMYQGNDSNHAELFGLYHLYRLECKARALAAVRSLTNN